MKGITRIVRCMVLLAAFGWLPALFAASVTAELSADETTVGVPVELQVRVNGTTNVLMPDIDVDGLMARLTGRSTQVQIINGRMTTSGIYSYTILAQREGTFDIPALEIDADGQKLKTNPFRLTVQPGAAPSRRPAAAAPLPPTSRQRRQPADANGRTAYAELVVPKKSIYVGEVVPVEIRFYFTQRVAFRLTQEPPQVSGEGFTVEKLSDPQQTEETVDGEPYNVVAIKTAITAVKSGWMKLPTISWRAIASVPSRGPAGMDDVFTQFFGRQGMPGFTDDQEIKVTSEPTDVQVKALPAEGRPESFSGAVGEFTVTATAAPLKAAPGDPVTLKVAVTGRGNFNAMGEPRLVDTTGWRVYPPTDRFEPTDKLGFAGTKTFDNPIVAQQPQTRTPAAEFSYFDPNKEKYFTVRTEPVSIDAAASPQAAVAAADKPSPSPTPAPDENHLLAGRTNRSWQPLLVQPRFWMLNGAAALFLIGLVAFGLVRRARSGQAGQRAALKRRRNQQIALLDRSTDEDFARRAYDVLSTQAELAGERGAVEMVRAIESRGGDAVALNEVLAKADEVRFGGGTISQIEPERRRRITQAIKEACR